MFFMVQCVVINSF